MNDNKDDSEYKTHKMASVYPEADWYTDKQLKEIIIGMKRMNEALRVALEPMKKPDNKP